MALTTNTQSQAAGISNRTTGQVVTDSGGAVNTTFTPGFVPRYIKIFNQTDATFYEWLEGMAADSAFKTAPVATTPAASQVTYINANAITNNGDGSFLVNAALIPASKTLFWIAEG